MSLLSKTLFASNHIVKEYILVLKDESLKLFLDDVNLRSIGNKTNCYIELTNRILNRRVNSFKLIKYAIIKIVGSDESAIRQCNRLLENLFPLYRHRKEYQKRTECCTLFSREFIPDNSSLYFPFQRTGATTYQFGDVLIKSPYEPTVLRPNQNCQWRMGDHDLVKGITITQHKQVETYLSYHFRKSSVEQEPYDPKAPIRYVYDDFNNQSYDRNSRRRNYFNERGEYVNENEYDTNQKTDFNVSPSQNTGPTRPVLTEKKKEAADSIATKGGNNVISMVEGALLDDSSDIFVGQISNNDKFKQAVTWNTVKKCSSLPYTMYKPSGRYTVKKLSTNYKKPFIDACKRVTKTGPMNVINEVDLHFTTNLFPLILDNLLNEIMETIIIEKISAIQSNNDYQYKEVDSVIPHIENSDLKNSFIITPETFKKALLHKFNKVSKDSSTQYLKEIDEIMSEDASNCLIDETMKTVFDTDDEMLSDSNISFVNICLSIILQHFETELLQRYFDFNDDELLSSQIHTFEEELVNEEDEYKDNSTEVYKFEYDDYEDDSSHNNILDDKTLESHKLNNYNGNSTQIQMLRNNLTEQDDDNKSYCTSKFSDQSKIIKFRLIMNIVVDKVIIKLQNEVMNDTICRFADDWIKNSFNNVHLAMADNIPDIFYRINNDFIVNPIIEKGANDERSLEQCPNSNDRILITTLSPIMSDNSLWNDSHEGDVEDVNLDQYNKMSEDIIYYITNWIVEETCGNVYNHCIRFEVRPDTCDTPFSFDQIICKELQYFTSQESINSQGIDNEIDSFKNEDDIEKMVQNIESLVCNLLLNDVSDMMFLHCYSLETNVKDSNVIQFSLEAKKKIFSDVIIEESIRSECIIYEIEVADIRNVTINNTVNCVRNTGILTKESFECIDSTQSSNTQSGSVSPVYLNGFPNAMQPKGLNVQNQITFNTYEPITVTKPGIEVVYKLSVIEDRIVNRIYNKSCEECLEKIIANIRLLEPTKNPSATLIKSNVSQNLTHKQAFLKLNKATKVSQNPCRSKNSKRNFSNKIEPLVSNTMINSKKDYDGVAIEITDKDIEITKEYVNEKSLLKSKSHKPINRIAPVKVSYPTEYQPHNVLNVTSSNELGGLDTHNEVTKVTSKAVVVNISTGSAVTNMEKNYYIINIDVENDDITASTDHISGKYVNIRSQVIVNVESDLKYENADYIVNLQPNFLSCTTKNSLEVPPSIDVRNNSLESLNIEDSQDPLFPLSVPRLLLSQCEEIFRKKMNSQCIHKSVQESLNLCPESVNSLSLFLPPENKAVENSCFRSMFHPTVERWIHDNFDIFLIYTNVIMTVTAHFGTEMSGELHFSIHHDNALQTIIKFSDVISSKFTNHENSVTGYVSTVVYTTVSIDNDIEFENSNEDSIGDTLSSMTDDTRTHVINVDGDKCEPYVVDREKIILIIENDTGNPTNVIKLNQLRNCSQDDLQTDTIAPDSMVTRTINIYSNSSNNRPYPEVSTSKQGLRSILHSNCSKTNWGNCNSKTASFDNETDSTSYLHVMPAQYNMTCSLSLKQPKVKKTLLDLSKEAKSKPMPRQVIVYENIPTKDNEFPEIRHLFQSADTDDNFKSSSSRINDFLSSSTDITKSLRKSRTRTLSDMLKFKAKQIIAKLNPLKKSCATDTKTNTSSVSLDNLNRTYVLSEVTSKSSVDSDLSRNSLARYWNIHKCDSIKLLKVKERSQSVIRASGNNYFSDY